MARVGTSRQTTGPLSRHLPGGLSPIEARTVWYAACLSVTLALVALLPSAPLRILACAAGGVLAATLSPIFLRRGTPFSAAVATVVAAACSTATVIWLSGLPWETGISWSQAGGIGRPTAWLFTSTSLCFGIGVLATGRLIVREGYRRGDLTSRGYLVASTLPALSFMGFVVVALCPVGGAPVLAAAHNVASWAALGSFWFGMVASAWLRGLSRTLRCYSAVAAVIVFGTWLPNGLRFMRLTEARPISMLVMELVVFPLCFVWFCWLAREWSPSAQNQGNAVCLRELRACGKR